jgi:hypothetical protein
VRELRELAADGEALTAFARDALGELETRLPPEVRLSGDRDALRELLASVESELLDRLADDAGGDAGPARHGRDRERRTPR